MLPSHEFVRFSVKMQIDEVCLRITFMDLHLLFVDNFENVASSYLDYGLLLKNTTFYFLTNKAIFQSIGQQRILRNFFY